ncbi:MAG TPA: hypothetical protein VG847_12325 [Chitinophagaceae bacterium]|nr:hypothetical protein [Chitinophagaceae bacterium]
MIEVFKTNITSSGRAVEIINTIHNTFPDCNANFDLDDCDNILRVECKKGTMDVNTFIQFLQSIHCKAEILEDVVTPLPMFVLA